MIKIIEKSVNELTEYENNTKLHPQSQIDTIKKSIEQFGFNDPIAIWGEGNLIIEGHGRLIAAKQLGISEVPCIRLDHLSDDERKAYTIAHNATSLNSGFDLEKLNAELASIDFDMAMFGLDEQIKDIEREFQDIDSTNESNIKTGAVLDIDGEKVLMSAEETTSIKQLLQSYIDKNGVSFGFVRYLINDKIN